MNTTSSWVVLLALGLLLIICGAQGSLGLVLAVVFVPGDLLVDGSAFPPKAVKGSSA
jgi:hypothetical protein